MVNQLRTIAARAVAVLVLAALSIGAFPSSGVYPSYLEWLPLIGGVQPTLYADFTSEGQGNHYWFNGQQYAGAAAWLTATSGTFSRASTGTYTNSAGNLATAANNVLRFDYDAVALAPKGVLLEGASTNLQIDSNTFSSWSLTGTSVSQNLTGPDGVANSGWTLTANAGGTGQLGAPSSPLVPAGGKFTVSVFVAPGTNNFVYIICSDGVNFVYPTLNAATGANGGNASQGGTAAVSVSFIPAGDGWLRAVFSFSGFTVGNSLSLNVGVSNAGGSTTASASGTLGVYGFQFEATTFVSSYIPTVASTVTRAIDSLSVSQTVNHSTATILSRFYNTAAQGGIFSVDDGTANNRIDYRYVSALSLVSSGGTLEDSLSLTAALGAGFNKVAISAQAGTGTHLAAVNGSAAGSGNIAAMPTALTELLIGNLPGGGQQPYADVAAAGFWPVAASSAQLQTLTH